MSTVVQERPVRRGADGGGGPARRAVVRWAWRLFRREWRRQTLVLALLTVAVAATTVGLAVASNSGQLGPDPTFGTANTIISLPGSDSGLRADLAAAARRFGAVDVVVHQSVALPGSVSTFDLRAENPQGLYVHSTLRLDAGRYPSGPDQAAVSSDVARVFALHIGSLWHDGGRTVQIVGLVENPLDLSDQFTLVAPGGTTAAATVSVLVDANQQSLQSLRLPSGNGVDTVSRGSSSKTAAEAVVLVLATIGLLFIGLLAVAGFAVMAQRRLRALGMLGSLGATDRHIRLVLLANGAAVGGCAAVVGTAAGLVGWLAFAPRLASVLGRRIDRFNLPWGAMVIAMVLAFATAVAAAWWPARAVARLPVVAALSGRPPRPQPAHRFGALGALLLAAGLVLLAFADQHRTLFIITGIVSTVIGLLFLAPLAIAALARLGRGAPIAVRLAWRDLARYQARSGAALGAATLAVGIAATIAISAAAAQGPGTAGNLPADELVVYPGSAGVRPGDPVPVLTAAQQATLRTRVDQLATVLHARTLLPMEAAFNPGAAVLPSQPGPGGQPGGQVTASLAHIVANGRGEEVMPEAELYVATPVLLAHYGIHADQISSTTDVITSRTDLGGLQIFLPVLPSDQSGAATRQPPPSAAAHPNIQTVRQLPRTTSDPNTLITTYGMQMLGLQPLPVGWLIQAPHALTAPQIDTARKTAASVGLAIETRSAGKSLAALRDWSTAAGILLALGVLAMTVGLIRSETAADLRTLAATGASSTTRRTLTGATAGALALLGAVLGTAGAYAALLSWHRASLHPLTHVPIVNLLVIIVGLPLIASTAGWLLAGQEPSIIARPRLE